MATIQVVFTDSSGVQDSTLLGGLADMDGPVLAGIDEEIMMRGILVLMES